MRGSVIPALRIAALVFSSKSRRRSYRGPQFNLPSSCAPALRWCQGQALRVRRNLDTAGRGRMIESAGSEGMPLSPHQGNGNAEASDHKLLFRKCAWSLNCSLWETGTGLFYLDFVFVGGFGLRNNTRFSEGRFLIVQSYSSASA